MQADLRSCVSSLGYTLKSSTVGYAGVFNFCFVCLDSGSLFVALVGLELLVGKSGLELAKVCLPLPLKRWD